MRALWWTSKFTYSWTVPLLHVQFDDSWYANEVWTLVTLVPTWILLHISPSFSFVSLFEVFQFQTKVDSLAYQGIIDRFVDRVDVRQTRCVCVCVSGGGRGGEEEGGGYLRVRRTCLLLLLLFEILERVCRSRCSWLQLVTLIPVVCLVYVFVTLMLVILMAVVALMALSEGGIFKIFSKKTRKNVKKIGGRVAKKRRCSETCFLIIVISHIYIILFLEVKYFIFSLWCLFLSFLSFSGKYVKRNR